MSKKSYKKLQNRLYREIKRRIIAEKRPLAFTRTIYKPINPEIDTLKIERIIPPFDVSEENNQKLAEFIKQDLARQITNELLANGYFLFESGLDPITGAGKIRCRLRVCKPIALPYIY